VGGSYPVLHILDSVYSRMADSSVVQFVLVSDGPERLTADACVAQSGLFVPGAATLVFEPV